MATAYYGRFGYVLLLFCLVGRASGAPGNTAHALSSLINAVQAALASKTAPSETPPALSKTPVSKHASKIGSWMSTSPLPAADLMDMCQMTYAVVEVAQSSSNGQLDKRVRGGPVYRECVARLEPLRYATSKTRDAAGVVNECITMVDAVAASLAAQQSMGDARTACGMVLQRFQKPSGSKPSPDVSAPAVAMSYTDPGQPAPMNLRRPKSETSPAVAASATGKTPASAQQLQPLQSQPHEPQQQLPAPDAAAQVPAPVQQQIEAQAPAQAQSVPAQRQVSLAARKAPPTSGPLNPTAPAAAEEEGSADADGAFWREMFQG